MKQDSSLQLTPAAALVELQAARPELHAITWTIGEQPGVLAGYHIDEAGHGALIDVVAAIVDGTVLHSSVSRDGDRQGVAQVVATYHGVSLVVWVSYPLTGARGRANSELHDVFARRQLGTLLCLPGGAA